jgi:hypothetical protein
MTLDDWLVTGAALNLPRGHNDKIHLRNPARTHKAVQLLNAIPVRGADIVGLAEFGNESARAWRKHPRWELDRARPNTVRPHDRIGNALAWRDHLTVVDETRLSYAYPARPSGLHMPVRLLSTGQTAVVGIQVHVPTVRDASQQHRAGVVALVSNYAEQCWDLGLSTLVLGDMNATKWPGLDELAECDVMKVLGLGVDRIAAGVVRDHHQVTDHTGIPWATVQLRTRSDAPRVLPAP